MKASLKAQSSFEYVLLLAGIMLLVMLVFVLIHFGALPEAEHTLTNSTDVVASLKAGIN